MLLQLALHASWAFKLKPSHLRGGYSISLTWCPILSLPVITGGWHAVLDGRDHTGVPERYRTGGSLRSGWGPSMVFGFEVSTTRSKTQWLSALINEL